MHALEGIDFRTAIGVAIPREVREVVESGEFLGTLHRIVEGAPFPIGLQGAARARLCAGIGRFLAALHAVPVDVASDAGVANLDMWQDEYRGLIEQTLPQLGPSGRSWLTNVANEFSRRGTRSAPRVLIHGDLSRHHLFGNDRGEIGGAIDFGDAAIADPARDFAGVLINLGWRDL